MVALSITILYLAAIIPISTIAIMTIASCLIPITIIRADVKTAFFVYIASTIIAFFLVPIIFVIYYAFFFGFYGIIKYYIEKIKKMIIEIILKLVFFDLILVILLLILNLPLINISSNIPFVALIIGSQVGFILYDYSVTLIITSYLEKAHKKKSS